MSRILEIQMWGGGHLDISKVALPCDTQLWTTVCLSKQQGKHSERWDRDVTVICWETNGEINSYRGRTGVFILSNVHKSRSGLLFHWHYCCHSKEYKCDEEYPLHSFLNDRKLDWPFHLKWRHENTRGHNKNGRILISMAGELCTQRRLIQNENIILGASQYSLQDMQKAEN